jgi:D-tyrosyl-tRNA(Tyr) deacylase
VGFTHGDGDVQVQWMADKIVGLRLFADGEEKMNLGITEVAGAILVVSQFTLYGDVRKGRRPSFDAAAPPEVARPIYEAVVRELRASGLSVATGEFQAMMHVESINDGPVTVLVDSRRQF